MRDKAWVFRVIFLIGFTVLVGWIAGALAVTE